MKIAAHAPAAALAATLLALASSLAAPAARAAGVDSLSKSDSVAGLKAALGQGTDRAVSMLGATDGFLGNPKVRIPLPAGLAKGERMFKMLGLDAQAKELVTAMNRAAEAAVPEARTLLVDSVKQMSVDDARLGAIDSRDARVEDYVTRKALDGLFVMIVEEERAIRKDPLGQASKLLKNVFGAVKK